MIDDARNHERELYYVWSTAPYDGTSTTELQVSTFCVGEVQWTTLASSNKMPVNICLSTYYHIPELTVY
jgi:hypothetical protein